MTPPTSPGAPNSAPAVARRKNPSSGRRQSMPMPPARRAFRLRGAVSLRRRCGGQFLRPFPTSASPPGRRADRCRRPRGHDVHPLALAWWTIIDTWLAGALQHRPRHFARLTPRRGGGGAYRRPGHAKALRPSPRQGHRHTSGNAGPGETAVDARLDPEFVVMARTDALQAEGLQAAIDRGRCLCRSRRPT